MPQDTIQEINPAPLAETEKPVNSAVYILVPLFLIGLFVFLYKRWKRMSRKDTSFSNEKQNTTNPKEPLA